MNQQPLSPPTITLSASQWRAAITGCLLGTLIGLLASLLLAFVPGLLNLPAWQSLTAVASGGIAGAIQHRFLRRAAGSVPIWLSMSGLGWGVMSLSSSLLSAIGIDTGVVVWIGAAALAGALIGTTQWLVLRQHMQAAGWWIGINAGSWAGLSLIFLTLFGGLVGLGSW